VCKILPGIKDPHICDWINTNCAHVQGLTFLAFIIEFHAAYLEEDWEEDTKHTLLGMTQGSMSFWNYAFSCQSKSSLLNSTASYLNEQKHCHQLEAGMEEHLSKKVNSEKVNKENNFKKWLADMKRIDKGMKSECEEFERIACSTRETGHRSNALTEPSCHANTGNYSASALSTATATGHACAPTLTPTERKLLLDNEGCLKCHHVFINHISKDCPNDFTDGSTNP
jgi:hypothetical protein